MAAFLLQRAGQFFIALFAITLITFGIMHLAPGEPTDFQTGMNPRVSAHARENLRRIYGLDQPLYLQYWNWLKRFLELDLGESMVDGQPVRQKILDRVPITATIQILSLLVILAIAVPIGVVSAAKQYSLFDKATTIFVFVGFATPDFWLALLLMIFFGVYLGWLPISGYQSIDVSGMSFPERIVDWSRHLILPIFISAFGGMASLSRYVRSKMLEVVRQDYIRTARAKGLTENRVIYKHALRNALIPVITILGLSIPGLVGGGIIFETIFSIPGMGQLFYQAVIMRDYPVVMGMTMIVAALTLLGNFVADVTYALVDPKVRLGEEAR